jgi:hypothetical protein
MFSSCTAYASFSSPRRLHASALSSRVISSAFRSLVGLATRQSAGCATRRDSSFPRLPLRTATALYSTLDDSPVLTFSDDDFRSHSARTNLTTQDLLGPPTPHPHQPTPRLTLPPSLTVTACTDATLPGSYRRIECSCSVTVSVPQATRVLLCSRSTLSLRRDPTRPSSRTTPVRFLILLLNLVQPQLQAACSLDILYLAPAHCAHGFCH